MTYMVMETHLSYSVVLDESGRFLKVANMNYEVGQIVEKVVPINMPENKTIPVRMISAIGAMAACFVMMFSMYWSNYMSPFASIYLTINPEIRLEISKKDTVIRLEGINEDGANLIAGYSFRGKSITQVAADLIDTAIDLGFLSDGGLVTVNIDSPDETWFTNTGITLRQNLNDHLSERMTIIIEVKQYSPAADPAFKPDEAQEPATETPATVTQPPSVQLPAGDTSGYSDSAYGKQTTPTYSAPANEPASINDSSYEDSSYNTSVPSADDGNSGYSEPEPDDDSGDSNHQEPDLNEGDSGYDVGDDDSDSNYSDNDD